jgi:SAM-dependent methyltransferase
LLTSGGRAVERLLDIGCGTGRHAAAWCARGVRLTGVDTDSDAIAQARSRVGSLTPAPEFHAGDVINLPRHGFDAATALFHVVNYIPDATALIDTFRAVRARLNPGAAFAFDAWNGIAALLDPPRVKDDTVTGAGGRRLRVRTTPEFDRMAQTVILDVQGSVEDPDGSESRFATRYRHRLWTPREIIDLAEICGFRLEALLPADGSTATADERCWKILFVMTAKVDR